MAETISRKKKKKGNTLSFPITIRCDKNRAIVRTLKYLHSATQEYLKKLYKKEILEELKENQKAYKILEAYTPIKWKKKLPSRINRGILEVSGRILRAMNERRNLFHLLIEKFGENPQKWSYKKLVEEYQIYIKSQYITNLAEQAENHNEIQGRYAKDFLDFQKHPKISKPMISYAPDDGQAIQIKKEGNKLFISLKVISDRSRTGNPEWEWIEIAIPIPEFLEPCTALAPDLRLVNLHGSLIPVLDYKIEIAGVQKVSSPRFITVDWGTRKLLTLCIFDKNGKQISTPIFLKFEPIQQKLLRIRHEIDHLKSVCSSIAPKSSLWKKYKREIAKRWRKFRAIQKELAHLASNVIVLVAQIYGCSEIYIEWLKSLKSQKFSHELNWVINTTVRQAIYDLVSYKSKLLGIVLKRPLSPYHTSKRCPRCGKIGIHTQAPDRKESIPSGSWFFCPSCKYNADRDYVACCNLARKALYGNLTDQTKGIAYMTIPISDLLFRQSMLSHDSIPRTSQAPLISQSFFHRERLRHHLSGWKEVCFLNPQKFFRGTLRS